MKLSMNVCHNKTEAADYNNLDIFLGSAYNKDYYLCKTMGLIYNRDYVVEIRNNSVDGYTGYYIDYGFIDNMGLKAAIEKAKKLLVLR